MDEDFDIYSDLDQLPLPNFINLKRKYTSVDSIISNKIKKSSSSSEDEDKKRSADKNNDQHSDKNNTKLNGENSNFLNSIRLNNDPINKQINSQNNKDHQPNSRSIREKDQTSKSPNSLRHDLSRNRLKKDHKNSPKKNKNSSKSFEHLNSSNNSSKYSPNNLNSSSFKSSTNLKTDSRTSSKTNSRSDSKTDQKISSKNSNNQLSDKLNYSPNKFKDLETKFKDLELKYSRLKRKYYDLEQEKVEKLKVTEELNKKLSILKLNISSLFKTARNEIDRKNHRISELQSEVDTMKFRRAKRADENQKISYIISKERNYSLEPSNVEN